MKAVSVSETCEHTMEARATWHVALANSGKIYIVNSREIFVSLLRAASQASPSCSG